MPRVVAAADLKRRFTTGEKIYLRRDDLPQERGFTTGDDPPQERRFTSVEKILLRRGDLPQERRFTTGEKTYHGEKIHQERRFTSRTIHHGEKSYLRRGD